MLHWDHGDDDARGRRRSARRAAGDAEVVCHEILTDPALPDLSPAAEATTISMTGNAPICARCGGSGCTRPRCRADLVAASSKAGERLRDGVAPGPPRRRFRRDPAVAANGSWAWCARSPPPKRTRLGKSPYDALLDAYEPDGSTAEIDRLFDRLAAHSARPHRRRARAAGGRRRPNFRPAHFRSPRSARRRIRLMDAAGLRFRAWPARYQPSSLLRRHARRRAHHHAL